MQKRAILQLLLKQAQLLLKQTQQQNSIGVKKASVLSTTRNAAENTLSVASTGLHGLLDYTKEKSRDTAENVGYTLGKIFKLPYYDSTDLGPYSEFVQNMKDTETAELLLREADRLRRRARVEKRKLEEEEKLRSEVSRSRYF